MINVLQAVILTKDKEMVLTPTYYVFKMYNVHQDAKMLPIEIKCNHYTSGAESIDAINASASIKDGVVSITLCNLDPVNSQAISFDIQGLKIASVFGQIVTANKINALNDFGKKEEVTLADFKNAKLNRGQVEATIPAKSVVLIQLK
jgi:alpha-N-arabinofuranosidase